MTKLKLNILTKEYNFITFSYTFKPVVLSYIILCMCCLNRIHEMNAVNKINQSIYLFLQNYLMDFGEVSYWRGALKILVKYILFYISLHLLFEAKIKL